MRSKVVLITGSSHGIGRQTALKFAHEGYHVVINGRKESEALNTLKSEIINLGVCCLAIPCNVGNRTETEFMFSCIQKQFGSLDVLINNAGISYIGLLTDMKFDEWEQMLAANLTSVFNCCQLAIPYMLPCKQGKIINVSSVWGISGASCETAYSATKGGINSFTKALAKELAPSNIQVNAAAFGMINTRMNHDLTLEEQEEIIDSIPAGRIASPSEAADFLYMLAQSNSYLTGQIISFDGGWL